MIYNAKKITPFIDFGFGITEKTAATGSPVRVWLSTLYNRNAYTFELTAPGTVTKISDYEYVVTHGTKGLYPITLSVRSKDGSISFVSNTITLNLY